MQLSVCPWQCIQMSLNVWKYVTCMTLTGRFAGVHFNISFKCCIYSFINSYTVNTWSGSWLNWWEPSTSKSTNYKHIHVLIFSIANSTKLLLLKCFGQWKKTNINNGRTCKSKHRQQTELKIKPSPWSTEAANESPCSFVLFKVLSFG